MALSLRPADIDAVLLTHAHIDHSGLLPKLVREGFRGPIYGDARHDRPLLLHASRRGQHPGMEVAALNRRNAARGGPRSRRSTPRPTPSPSLDAFRPVEYETGSRSMPGIRARYWNAGHLLGSASIEIEFVGEGESGEPLRVLLSGDVGPDAKLLQPDPEAPAGLDYVISESTYGDGDRPSTTAADTARPPCRARCAMPPQRKGALLIPAFAVERTQELIVDLIDLMERGEIPTAPIFLDSPLGDPRHRGVSPSTPQASMPSIDLDRLLSSPQLRFTETVDESKSIAKLAGFHIIIAASGMCDAGRIRHHLKRWLWRREATVLLVGFQAQGTLGRFLHDGAKAVRIQGEEIKVAARIRYIDEYSGHADGPELARWIAARRPIHRGVFLVHGEEPAFAGLAERIAERTIPTAQIFHPVLDDIYELCPAKLRH